MDEIILLLRGGLVITEAGSLSQANSFIIQVCCSDVLLNALLPISLPPWSEARRSVPQGVALSLGLLSLPDYGSTTVSLFI